MQEDELLTSLLHGNQRVVSEACDDVYGKLIAVVVSMKGQWLQRSKVLGEQHTVQGDLEATRNNHVHQLKQIRCHIMDSVGIAYQELESFTDNAYLDIEVDNDVASAVVECSASDIPETPKCARQLDKLACNLRERLAFLSAELDTASIYLGTAIKADMSMPEDLRDELNELPTIPLPLSALSCASDMADQPKVHLSCSTSSATIQLPEVSRALALLSDKILLLADLESGMSEVCSESRCKLSRWLPPAYDFDDFFKEATLEDSVVAVLALSEGRAAVALARKGVVVLLRRCKKTSHDYMRCDETHFTWTEYRRLDPLYFSPHILSSHGDVLAAGSLTDRMIQLLSIRCGRHFGPAMISDYDINSLAVCSKAVIIGSRDKVELDGGRLAYVIDAYSLTNHNERLWRRELSSDEELKALCTDSMGSYLYAAVWMSDRCSGIVAAYSLTDSSALRHTVLSLDDAPQSPLLPSALSVWNDSAADQQQPLQQQSCGTVSRPMLLAVLYSDVKEVVKSVVTVHRIGSGLYDCGV